MSVCKVIAGSLTEWEWEGKRSEGWGGEAGERERRGVRKQVQLEEKREEREEGREGRRAGKVE